MGTMSEFVYPTETNQLFMFLHTDTIPEFVYGEIELVSMCLDFGRSASLAKQHPLCCLCADHKAIMDVAVADWKDCSEECVGFLRKAFDLLEPSVIRFAGVHMIQCERYGVFAFAENAMEYHRSAEHVWLIYYNLEEGCMFMCYQPSRGGRGSYWCRH
jgi:hypothetical protein